MMNKLKLLSTSFIMALTLAAPFATYAMEPEEDHKAVRTSRPFNIHTYRAVTKKASPASRRFLYTYLGTVLELDTPILEAIYYSAPLRQFERFLNGKLIYKPDPNSDKGMVVLPIVDLANPLDGEFDLSQCGDVGKYLSINTGYRKGRRPENKDKVEIWFAPRSLIEKNLSGSASHFKDIMNFWGAPVGTIFTWGDWYDLRWHQYIINENFNIISDGKNLYEKCSLADSYCPSAASLHWYHAPQLLIMQKFSFHF